MDSNDGSGQSGNGSSRLSILLVEDTDLQRKVAVAHLQRAGHSVVDRADGPAAIEAVKAGNFDLVLMDVRMPGTDGLETTRQIRALADRRKAHVTILALTANDGPEDRELCLKAGMNGVLRKPLSTASLDAALGSLSPKTGCGTASVPEHRLIDQGHFDRLAEAIPAERLPALYAMACQSIIDTAQDLRAAWSNGDLATTGKAAHRLAGVAANFGCPALAEIAAAIESDCRNGDHGRSRAESLEQLLAASLAVLSRAAQAT